MSSPVPLPFDPIDEARRQWVAHGWEQAARNMVAVSLIMRAQQILLARAEAVLKPLGLSFSRFGLLRLLRFSKTGRLPMVTASARLQVQPTTLASAVERLAKDGLVERQAHPRDGRSVLVVLTPHGADVVDRATELLNEGLFGDLGLRTESVDQLNDILTEFRRAAGDFAEPEF
ncbi:MarR family winged helix-turn-helix transcriptional regulator [Sinomonas sp. P10A9]|uniref:MarR family winged helix-turn-helix transcriptional regulator n=1 Tax=Sinomonas puerhi TaxID=3238584 RepID=A0AB39L5L2_9MICC